MSLLTILLLNTLKPCPCLLASMHMGMRACISCMYVYVCMSCVWKYMYIYCVCVCVRMYVCVCMYVCKYMYVST